MSNKFKFELDYDGVGELLKSQEVAELTKEIASIIRNQMPNGYDTDSYQGTTRNIASVYTTTKAAYNHEMDTDELRRVCIANGLTFK